MQVLFQLAEKGDKRDARFDRSKIGCPLYSLCEQLRQIAQDTPVKVKLLAALPSDFARKFTTLCSRSWVRVMCERLPTALEDGGSGSTREEAHEDGYHSPSLDDIPLMSKLGRAVCYLHDLPPVVVTHNCNHGGGSAPEQEALRCTTERSALRSLHSQRGGTGREVIKGSAVGDYGEFDK